MAMIIETTVYPFTELSDRAKEKARDWYRADLEVDYDCVLEDANSIAALMGIRIDTRHNTKSEPAIYFSGFCSQGDGACFVGSYAYAKGSAKAVRQYAPLDTVLHGIADQLQAIQSKHFFKLEAKITHSGNYYHENSVSIDVEDSRDSYRDIGNAEDEIKECLRDFMRWIYRALEREYDYANSEAACDECLTANEWYFKDSGAFHH